MSEKKTAQLFALFSAWLVIVIFVVWALVKGFSLFSLISRSLVIGGVIYSVVFYYTYWVLTRGLPPEEKKEIKHESGQKD